MVLLTEINGAVPFRPKARLLRLLGDELISDEVMAIVELVKNAYDADAREVTVGLYDLNDPARARIEVRDDGSGMDLDTILNAWLEPATDHKCRGGRKGRTPLGRYPLGEKGVGRFAGAKLGHDLELISRPPTEEFEISLHVRWDLYGDGKYLDEVQNRWEKTLPMAFPGEAHGVLLRISEIPVIWDSRRVARVRDNLTRLISPFSSVQDFRIILDCPEFPEFSGHIATDLLDHAPYQLSGQVDEIGLLHIDHAETDAVSADQDVVDLKLFDPEQFRATSGTRLPECGPFRLALFVWDLDSVGLGRAAMDRRMRAALKRSCGISIYRDGFRVWPYGSSGNDWLELNQRRVNNPTMRISTNQVVGIVEITQEFNPELRDRTSREGLIDAPALNDLRSLVLGAIAELEEERFASRQRHSGQRAENVESDPVIQLLTQVQARSQDGGGTKQLLASLAATYRQTQVDQKRQYDLLVRLAGEGLGAEQIGKEISRTIAAASTHLRIARNVASRDGVSEQITRNLDHMETYIGLLSDQLNAMEPLLEADGSLERELVDVAGVVRHAATVFAFHFRKPAGIQLTIEDRSPVSIRMVRSHLLQVLLNLFHNSIYWLGQMAQDHRPEIRVRVSSNPPELLFADNGPGVRRELRNAIFQPFFTGRSGGRGLGLHVAETVLNQYGFRIELLDEPTILPGANFHICLERLTDDRPTGSLSMP